MLSYTKDEGWERNACLSRLHVLRCFFLFHHGVRAEGSVTRLLQPTSSSAVALPREGKLFLHNCCGCVVGYGSVLMGGDALAVVRSFLRFISVFVYVLRDFRVGCGLKYDLRQDGRGVCGVSLSQ